MLTREEAIEIASIMFQREFDEQEIAKLVSDREFINRCEFRAFLIQTNEFRANYPDLHYALVAATSEKIMRAQIAHQISGMQDEIVVLRRITAVQEGEIVRLAGEIDRFLTTCRSNNDRISDLENLNYRLVDSLRNS